MVTFIAPKKLSPFYSVNRISRKLKKKVKEFNGIHFSTKTHNENMWYYLDCTNEQYKRFLISQLTVK